MKIAIIIPVYNEEAYLEKMLSSLVQQTKLPDCVLLVNDNSTDGTQNIIDFFTKKYSFISSICTSAKSEHSPGSKVIAAFYEGYNNLKEQYELIGKFDGDIILPSNYLEKTIDLFIKNPKVGIAGGNLYIKNKDTWEFENISEKTKVRGPIKLYRTTCFNEIGGLKKAIGWDTVDGLLAQYHGWKIATDIHLHVKHLKPTGEAYTKSSKHKQGEAFYRMRYGKTLTRIAALKLAIAKKNTSLYFSCMQGYSIAKKEKLPFIISKKEGKYIRAHRWQGIKNKIL